jgi:hypothetical protein
MNPETARRCSSNGGPLNVNRQNREHDMKLTAEQLAALRSIQEHPYTLTGLEDWLRIQGLVIWDGHYRLTDTGAALLAVQ